VKTFEYRLYTTTAQDGQLLACLKESRHLYNEMLEAVKAQYEASGKFLTKYDLTARFKGRGGEAIPATTVQCLADRLSKALKRFLTRKEVNRKVGFPRFKSANQWHSIPLRQFQKRKDAWIEDGRLRVPAKLGKRIKIKQHRPLEGEAVSRIGGLRGVDTGLGGLGILAGAREHPRRNMCITHLRGC